MKSKREKTWGSRLALACLASRAKDGEAVPRWPFDHSGDHARLQDRWANVNAALNGIYAAVGEKRDIPRVSLFEQQVRECE